MARIAYAVAGEGRGHAARTRALVEELRIRHEVRLFASGQALEMLQPLYAESEIEVRSLPALEFRYDAARRLDYVQSFVANVPTMLALSRSVDALAEQLVRARVELVITDFEPALPRAAARARIPFISLDHQHFLVACDLGELPPALRAYAAFMGPFVSSFCRGQEETIVSSFFRAPTRAGRADVVQVGVLMRPEVRLARPTRGDHLVAYLRRENASGAIAALAALGRETRVFGLGARAPEGRVSFHATHPLRFVEALASARALVTTAGNQLVGEALWLGKPVLAMPEPGNFEQRINAHFVASMGVGVSMELGELSAPRIHAFLEQERSFAAAITRARRDGTAGAVARVEHHLRAAGAALETRCDERSRSSTPYAGAAAAAPSSHAF